MKNRFDSVFRTGGILGIGVVQKREPLAKVVINVFSVMPEFFYPASRRFIMSEELDSGSTHCRNDVFHGHAGTKRTVTRLLQEAHVLHV